MAHSFASIMKTTWTKNLQTQLRKDFVGKNFTNYKFEGSFVGSDTIRFPRQAKITIGTLTDFRASLTKQDITTTHEDFSLDQYRYFAFDIALDEDIETYISPKSQAFIDAKEWFADEFDQAIMGQYVNAGYVVDDGDMETASNGGTGNPIQVSKTNVYDMVLAVGETLDLNYVPANSRFLALSPREKRWLLKAPELTRSTTEAEKRLEKGYVGMIDENTMYISNNLTEASGTRHALAGQGKPICFGSNVKPQVFVGSIDESADFTYLVKGATKFGVKTFTEWSERLVDLQIKI